MKILYISPENTVGTLTLWRKKHEEKGHECRTVTFFRSPKKFEEDICLNLPFNFTLPYMSKLRNLFFKFYRGRDGYYTGKKGYPPVWEKEGVLDSLFLKIKDIFWKPITLKAIKKYDLYNFDIYHFESGIDFLKDEFFVKELHRRGKKIICHYHGEDLRNRGVMPFINKISSLNLTNEVDLLERHPRINYLFLPYNTKLFKIKESNKKIIRVAHAPTNRLYKGSNFIIQACKKLEKEGLIKFDLIENNSHKVALEKKNKADIFIDQVGDRGGWGYGMNSVESLSMGICTLTEINDKYNTFIPDHPFVNINKNTLFKKLKELVLDRNKIYKYGINGKKWVEKHHDIENVSKKLYSYYNTIGF